jgi:hypothetical protein
LGDAKVKLVFQVSVYRCGFRRVEAVIVLADRSRVLRP